MHFLLLYMICACAFVAWGRFGFIVTSKRTGEVNLLTSYILTVLLWPLGLLIFLTATDDEE